MASVLYPSFVYLYLYMLLLGYWSEAKEFLNTFEREFTARNKDEIFLLESVEEAHLYEESVVQKYMGNKCVVTMSPYSYKILIHFVQLRMLLMLLHIFNLHVEFRITSDKWALEQHSSIALLAPYTAGQLSEINKRSVLWGRLLISPEAHSLREATKSKKGDLSLLLSSGTKIPLITLDLYLLLTANRQNDLVGRVYDMLDRKVKLSASNLPSIAIHTFSNAEHSLTAVDISRDAAILAAGFSDALIRIYIQDPKLSLDIDSVANEQTKEEKSAKEVPTHKKHELLFVGHSSTVTCLNFSPTGYFLLSGSLDGTIKLWSIHMGVALMTFKAHTLPIWDLKFAGIGYYFASACEDRTACVWRTCVDQPVRLLVGHLEAVEVVEFHPNVHYVATGSDDKTIRL
eukprot:TRINITY_DN1034_c0_g1_i2.p1 TRINITY_DN1034_c0_g1~~TRINITY_DN1034_c0_g1_i2.p1  ORF type:complete len:401 (+),score=109.59 TRINITY_DN1034_c0_g1_i2:1066-2268(+)